MHFTKFCYVSRYKNSGNSLAAQWLGLGTFTDMAQVQSLVRELRSQRKAKKKKREIHSTRKLSFSDQEEGKDTHSLHYCPAKYRKPSPEKLDKKKKVTQIEKRKIIFFHR